MDLTELLLEVENATIYKSPFVIYRKPDSSKIKALFQKDNKLLYKKEISASGFVFAPFDDIKKTILFSINNCKSVVINNVSNKPASAIEKIGDSSNLKNKTARLKHITLVEKAIQLISQNKFEKVILSRKEEIELELFDIKIIFKNLLDKYPLAFVYIWYHPKIGLWIGASPETLLKVDGDQYKTMALAGTQSYRGTMDVSWNDKEKQEQQFVADYIMSALDDKKLNIGRPFSFKAGSLIHICTEITGTLTSNMQLDDLIYKLHPTPAVCGLPKEEAKEYILKNEGYHREFYTGFLGELNMPTEEGIKDNKSTSLFVNLRCMKIQPDSKGGNNSAIIYIGGGITKDSDPEKEWEETVVKSEVMKRVLIV